MTERSGKDTIPQVSKETILALEHDLLHDDGFGDRVFRRNNNRNHELMSGVVAEAHRSSDGNMATQDSFIRGAEYILAALERTAESSFLASLWYENESVRVIGVGESTEDV